MSVYSKVSAIRRLSRNALRRSRKWWLRRPTYLRHFLKSVREFSRGDFSDLAQSPPAAKKLIVARIPSPKRSVGDWPDPPGIDVNQDAESVFRSVGVWPLGYAYPYDAPKQGVAPSMLFSPRLPGHRYAFSDQKSYLDSYAQYAFAMTHKKAGWDCFRHVEIMYSGAIPFMPDIEKVPPGTMVHYPKRYLSQVMSRLFESGDIPPREVFGYIRNHFNSHLTTRQMAKYLMSRVGMGTSDSVLFVDEAATLKADYTSNLTLIGLKQILGPKISVSHPLPYLYSDWIGNALKLYGRGFGYSRVLNPDLKTEREASLESLDITRQPVDSWAWIVVGSVARNPHLAFKVLERFPANRVILLHGEDTPLSPSETSDLVSTGAHIFVREISQEVYSGGSQPPPISRKV